MVKKGEKKEVAPKEPILIIPLGKGDYPRIEVFVDSHGSAVSIRDEEGGSLRGTRYHGIRPESFIKGVDDVVLSERMGKGRKKNYDASFESFLEMYREHKKFMYNALGGNL
jgi:hypothetical protein